MGSLFDTAHDGTGLFASRYQESLRLGHRFTSFQYRFSFTQTQNECLTDCVSIVGGPCRQHLEVGMRMRSIRSHSYGRIVAC